eukprot:TRINITY_DN20218_c0_g1_i1.p1 TRINITY_DN20218_c0_g1~~TRINITY_DN20218_c0_g1_i1.p1  ORF type:complete len:111 (-),score=17.60 TRINITY_DN20218_c0_g1_i1:47-379(-)
MAMEPLEVSITISGYGRTIRIRDLAFQSLGVQFECLANVKSIMESYTIFSDSQEGPDFAAQAKYAREKMRQVSLMRQKCEKMYHEDELNAMRQFAILQPIQSEQEVIHFW